MSSVKNMAPRHTPTKGARLAAFNRHRNDLLAILQAACERKPKTKSFDRKESWRHLEFMAWVYLKEEAQIEQKRMLAPAGGRAQLLRQLGTALGKGRCTLNEVIQDDLRGHLFLAWCESQGDPDLTDPIMDQFDTNFEILVASVAGDLAALEEAAFRAARQLRQRPGRPGGTAVLQHDFIISLESTYRNITGKRGGAGPGPFAKLVQKFLKALGRGSSEQTVLEAIKAAKRREENGSTSRWGRSLFANMRVGNPPPSP
jgi:hypothetical protein